MSLAPLSIQQGNPQPSRFKENPVMTPQMWMFKAAFDVPLIRRGFQFHLTELETEIIPRLEKRLGVNDRDVRELNATLGAMKDWQALLSELVAQRRAAVL